MSLKRISPDDVRHVALLSRLRLAEEEIPSYTDVLNSILEYFAKLNELDTSSVSPTSHSIEMRNVFREDIPQPSLPVDKAIANAPEVEDNYFRVPKIIQEM
ncbi:MAG TPA: Asp-tRNA(Asn)/Glu-tRNA(Gln) amidotransferase subunit GatC [Candidatus Sumerlaeota bacterium]|nr:Asp-tRNA(Asn)/Glu-tRNA(Gln) amidotransferase subunit GatC [Candidatus Sumerlaeota bacterium]HRU52943.1 Asp-tRNA(Asn)/Glu-tRNA(Gln) amidotransferase subunit GatC [Candidatus Sumerlaeia bacterium]HON50110.1 Asp-tRNA(Asn)/Glu-tRNA(Gln) amidotransferase subunit GatC [Candidatus Sumerlaeota bacterium]HOR63326.1 Asp-tRNA(Asn)/Glu-tRNA(Gln) amidotransferase subunit GatC [Candidatus Sumerlaeota bacterium]HPL74077.1 Asp-tRNA(Asn)/Glu-tRNA(Gln) amidotransferase subunit GatC [Candidatus Sumerlaeota bac